MSDLNAILPVLEGIQLLFSPLVEIAVHDAKSGVITHILGNLSKRTIGEPSPFHELDIPVEQFPDIFPPYIRTNTDGRMLKSTSITLRDNENVPQSVICINVDISVFQQVTSLFSTLMGVKGENPLDQFGNDPTIAIQTAIEEFLHKHNLAKGSLQRKEKRSIIQHLQKKGYLYFKNAPTLVAQILGVSRATIYNHIKEEK